ncbi:hypothetical protein [Actinosynnema sp. NPDC020468]|uniref:hypothetical protein n=1 Tax=Actinosynnema sp. NPDC020468 TaxID=3154488 RepID=UPI0033DA4D3B
MEQTGERPFTLARVFDVVDPATGPGFAADHPRVPDEAERRNLVAYLESGARVLVTPTLLTDVVEPARGAVVPTNFLTDGTWVWTDTVTYYLEHHSLAPEPDLLAHVNAHLPTAAPVDAATAQRAVAFVLSPSDDAAPVWRAR